MIRAPVAISLGIAVLFSGCAASSPAPGGASRTTAASAPSEETAIREALSKVAAKPGNYRIHPTDLVKVGVFQQLELGGEMRVSQNGTLTFPLIGSVTVGGLSVDEAQTLLTQKFSEYVKNPQVSVFIQEYAKKKIFILGEVRTPGSYDLPTENKLTVLEAVTMAGGFSNIAAPDRTRVIRGGDQNRIINIEVSAITKRGEKDKDIPLEPNDVIYVPQSLF